MLCPIFGAQVCAFDFAQWYDVPLYTVLDDGKASNSAVDCINLRVERDNETHRLHMLFMTELKSFGQIENAGVRMSFDGLSDILLMCDGTEEYDDSEYFAEMTDMIYDDKSMTVYMEVTVGIKPGLPDVMYFSIFDTDGIISNTYTVEFEDDTDDIGEEESQQDKTDKTEKTKKTRTTKIKTTKVKTTKIKTTKKKTTKTKTSKKSKTVKDDSEEIYDIEEKSENVSLDEEVTVSDDRKTVIIACSAAVIACAAGGCAVGIAKIIKKHDTDQG